MKYVGAIMVFLAGLGYAALYVRTGRWQLEVLEELQEILEQVNGEVRYGRRTLTECFLWVGRQKKTGMRIAVSRLGGEMIRGAGEKRREILRTGLEQEFESQIGSGGFGPGDTRKMAELISELICDAIPENGYQDEQMQRRALERSIEKTENLLQKKREGFQGKCRAAWSLGVMGGLMVVLLLI